MLSRVSRDLQQGVEQLLYEEAALLDDRRLDEWLDLFTDDARYVLLAREKVQHKGSGRLGDEFPTTVLTNDDKAFLVLRVRRLDTNLAHSERPPSFTRRLITNVRIQVRGSGTLAVRSNFQVYQGRLDLDDYTFHGTREDEWRQIEGAWKISRRQVLVDHIVLPRALTIFF